MQYLGPDAADIAHVHSLNTAYIAYLAQSPAARLAWPSELSALFEQASPVGRARVARSPFLIFSLAGYDVPRWQSIFASEPEAQLFAERSPPGIAEIEVVSATLTFLWQFVRRSPYAARVVSGASVAWCDALAASTPIELSRIATTTNDLLGLRFRRNTAMWRKMLTAGTSAETVVRSAARITALHTVLTRPVAESYPRVSAAACKIPTPSRSVAETRPVSKSSRPRYNTAPYESTVDKGSRKDLRKR